MKNKTSKFQKIILILILIMNVSILYFIYQNKENRLLVENYFNDFFNEKQEKKVEKKEVKIENKAIDTTNWKTYEDNLYDFKIKYPNSWAEPQIQEISDENFAFQYQVKFGTADSQGENDEEGFFVFVSKKNTTDKNNSESNYTCNQMQNSLDQINRYKSSLFNLFYNPKIADEDFVAYYSYQFKGQNFEYTLIPILNANSNFSLSGINELQEFELAKNTFLIDFENIQKKITEQERQEKARQLAIQKARQAQAEAQRIARLRSCAHPERKPSYSKEKGKHVDEDCCPDPDEWANPKCKYNASGYRIMINKK